MRMRQSRVRTACGKTARFLNNRAALFPGYARTCRLRYGPVIITLYALRSVKKRPRNADELARRQLVFFSFLFFPSFFTAGSAPSMVTGDFERTTDFYARLIARDAFVITAVFAKRVQFPCRFSEGFPGPPSAASRNLAGDPS